jgi:hypothetical protein
MDLVLDEQVQRFDVEHGYLAKAGVIRHIESTLHQCCIDPAGVHCLEGLLGARHRLKLDIDRSMGCLAPECLRNAMPSAPFLTGRHPEPDLSLARLVQGEERSERKRPEAEDAKEGIASSPAQPRWPNHGSGSFSLTLRNA